MATVLILTITALRRNVLCGRRAQREIGVRLALGARGRDVLKLVIGQGMKTRDRRRSVRAGGAYALTRVMATLLFNVSATDFPRSSLRGRNPGEVAIVACYLPARRATKVDPVIALRSE